MSVPLLIGLLILGAIVAAAAGVWRARDRGRTSVQSSLMVLVVVVAAAAVLYVLLQRR